VLEPSLDGRPCTCTRMSGARIDERVRGCGQQGSSSAVLDFDAPDLAAFPRLAAVRGAREVILLPGELLYIPPLWLHSVQGGRQGNAAVNVFWRHLPPEAYEPKDLYGNRDPVAANRAAAAAAEVRGRAGGWWSHS
jgi:tRNA wybutosine-synthesizing protein 4